MPNRRRSYIKVNNRQLGTDSWFLYIAECRDGSYYTGITKDVEKRIEAHNSGKGAKYTATHAPVKLVFQEPQVDYSAALRREYQIKSLPKSRKVRLVGGKSLPPPRRKARMSFYRGKKKEKRSRKNAKRSRR